MATNPTLRITELTKRFAGQTALDRVSLELQPGEIRGLVGENGAGKSTLIKTLAGIYEADEGTIEINGRVVQPHLHNPPIAFVHQDLGLVDELSVGENIALTMGFPRRGPLITWRQVWSRANEAYERMGLTAPSPQALVASLLPAEKALLGIVRALSTEASVAVLDEPTASLPAPDVSYLLDALRGLSATGTSILYVTHRLQELYEVADTVTILRGGREVAAGSMSEFSVDDIVERMLGRSLEQVVVSQPVVATGEPLVEVRDLGVRGKTVNFSVYPNEIVGIVGLRGAGQEAIGRALVGSEPAEAGAVVVGGQTLPRRASVGTMMGLGVSLLPSDRQRESTLPGMSLIENLFPGKRNRSGSSSWISHTRERRLAESELDRYDVRPRRPELPIDQLSGGNQQKVVVARVLAGGKRLVVLEEPTAGVDVGSKFQIHEFIRDAAGSGTAVVVVSSDFEEVVQLCTRVLVVVDGAITAEALGADISQERLIVLASSQPVAAPHA